MTIKCTCLDPKHAPDGLGRFGHGRFGRDRLRAWGAHGRDRFENLVHDLRELLRLRVGKNAYPSTGIIDSRFAISTPESGARGAYNGHKAKSGSKVHAVVDTMGHLLTLVVTAGNVDDRKPVYDLCEQVQELTEDNVLTMFADNGYTGEDVQDDANDNIIKLVVMKKPDAVKGFVLLPIRWVVEAIPPVSAPSL